MASTTNYNWSTPDDTSLVKDGAAAIRTLGSSIDTTTKALNPSTTLGDIEYRSSTANTNTRLGIGTTGQVLTVSDGVPSWAAPSTGGTWTTWTPTYTNLTIGNGTVVARYTQTGKTVTLYWYFELGSTSSVGSSPTVSLPVAAKYGNLQYVNGFLLNAGIESVVPTGQVPSADKTIFNLKIARVDQTYLIDNNVSATVPWTWGVSDSLAYTFTYEAA